jgi:integrase
LIAKIADLTIALDSVIRAMIGKQAKVLSDKHINSLLVFARRTRYPSRNRVIVLLSVKAGLRAGEIASLTWSMVLDPSGQIGSIISLESRIAKKGSGRLLPLHPDLRRALARLHRGETGEEPIVRSKRGGPMTPIGVVNWFGTAYRGLGLKGCSSHSGRPTFITPTGEDGNLAREAAGKAVEMYISEPARLSSSPDRFGAAVLDLGHLFELIKALPEPPQQLFDTALVKTTGVGIAGLPSSSATSLRI